MCTHKFIFPEETPGNYNRDGKTITGRCKCGVEQKAYGMRWMINKYDNFLREVPSQVPIDKNDRIW